MIRKKLVIRFFLVIFGQEKHKMHQKQKNLQASARSSRDFSPEMSIFAWAGPCGIGACREEERTGHFSESPFVAFYDESHEIFADSSIGLDVKSADMGNSTINININADGTVDTEVDPQH